MRASLGRAREEDEQLKAYARPNSLADNQKASGEMARITEEALDFQCLGQAWDHADSRWHLRHFWRGPAFGGGYVYGS